MAKIDIASRLKGQLAKVEAVKEVATMREIQLDFNHFDFSYLEEIECDFQIKEFLKQKSLQMINIQGNTVLTLGKICHEVAEELGRKGSPEGVYYKWLEFNGLSKNTALRHRKRYELFTLAEEAKLKEIMVLLTVKEIDLIHKEKETMMDILNGEKNPELKGIKEMLGIGISGVGRELIGVAEAPDFERSLQRFGNIMKNLKKTELSPKKQEKLENLLEQIEKLLG